MAQDKVLIQVRVDPDVKEAFEVHCKRVHRSMANLVGLLIARELDKAQDAVVADEELASQAGREASL